MFDLGFVPISFFIGFYREKEIECCSVWKNASHSATISLTQGVWHYGDLFISTNRERKSRPLRPVIIS